VVEPSPDRLELRSLRVLGTHGALAEERTRPQPFELDLDIALDLSAAAGSDALGDTADYGALAEVAAKVIEGPSFALLEALADAVAVAILAVDGRIEAVTVTLRKLRPPVGVDLGTAAVRRSRVRGAGGP
jgi:dihydroneopterin aldolase